MNVCLRAMLLLNSLMMEPTVFITFVPRQIYPLGMLLNHRTVFVAVTKTFVIHAPEIPKSENLRIREASKLSIILVDFMGTYSLYYFILQLY